MTDRKITSTVRLDLETRDKLRYLSKIMGKKQITFLKELVDEIFESVVSFETLNITYSRHWESLKLDFRGRSRMVRGIDTVKDFERKSKKLEKG